MPVIVLEGLRASYFTGDQVEGHLVLRPRPQEEGQSVPESDLLLIFRVREQTRLNGERKLYRTRHISKSGLGALDRTS
jgi:hypothetical protein